MQTLLIRSLLLLTTALLFCNKTWAGPYTSTVVAWGGLYDGVANVPVDLTNAVAVAGGWNETLALKSDGTVVGWGSGLPAASQVPPGLSNVVAIASGDRFCLALKADGTVAVWGYIESIGYTINLQFYTNAAAIAASKYQGLVLKRDGTVSEFGRNSSAENILPDTLTNIVAIAASSNANWFLKPDGSVEGFGSDAFQVGGNSFSTLAAGARHILLLSTNGTVTAAGDSTYQQTNVPAGLANIKAISAGARHSMALQSDGTVIVWGTNDAGQLTLPSSLTAVAAISAGDDHCVAIKNASPFITSDLQDVAIDEGANALLSISVFGSPPLRYQWLFNGAPLAKATNSTLFLTNLLLNRAGTYTVLVTNNFGAVASRSATLTVHAGAPVINLQPADLNVPAGTNISFTVAAQGTLPLSYQWQSNGTNLIDTTTSSLSLTNVQSYDSGDYTLIVSNAFGSISSATAHLTVNSSLASATILPASQSVAPGADVTFAVNATGTLPFSYQWQFNSVDIPGATDSILHLANVQLTNSGSYTIRVTNPVGSVVSAPGLLSVEIKQDFEWVRQMNPAGVTAYPCAIAADQQGSLYAASSYLGELSVGSTTLTNTNYFQNGAVFVLKYDQGGNVLWASGATNEYYYAGFTPVSVVKSLAADKTGNVYLAGYFSGGIAFGTNHLLTSAASEGFLCKLDPAGNPIWAIQTVSSNENHTRIFGLALDDDNNVLLTGAFDGNAAFRTNLITAAGRDDGFVAKVDQSGTFLWVNRMGGPQVDEGLGVAVDSEGNTFVTGDFRTTALFGSTNLVSLGDSDLFLAKYDAAGHFLWVRQGGGQRYDSGAGVAMDAQGNPFVTGTINGPAVLGRYIFRDSTTNTSSPQFNQMFLAKYDTQGNLLWANGEGGTNTTTALAVSVDRTGGAYVIGNFGEALQSRFETNLLSAANGGNNYIAKFTSEGSLIWIQQFASTNFDRFIPGSIAVDYEGNPAVVGYFSGSGSFGNTQLDIPSRTGYFPQYHLYVAKMSVLDPLSPPLVSINESSLFKLKGGAAHFGAVVTSHSPVTYQWFHNDLSLPGATNYNLVFTNLMLGDAGSYTVVASNANGSSTSAPVVLTVNAPAEIVVQPQSQTVLAPTNVTLALEATGNDPLFYQWYYNTLPVVGATDASLVLTNAQYVQSGKYFAIVTNAFGAATSAVVVLTVNSAPVVTAQPQSVTALAGTDVSFAPGLTGSTPFAYQWQFNGTHIPGATNFTLALKNIQISNQGDYTVIISNAFGSVITVPITLTVNSSAPVIVNQPQSISAILGAEAEFKFSVRGSEPMGFQWQLNGSAIPDATGLSLTFTNLEATDAGNYTVVATNAYGAVTSLVATLTIQPPPGFLWARQAGNPVGSDSGQAVDVDSLGNVYVAGYFSGTSAFGSNNLTSFGKSDIFVAKYDPFGNVLWVQQAGGGTNSDQAAAIAVDASGNAYVAGFFAGTASFGSTNITTTGSPDIFMAKYDGSGTLMWVKKAGGGSLDAARAIAVDPSGNIYLAGYFSSTANFGSTNLNATATFMDIFLAKYDNSGTLLWVRQAGGQYMDQAAAVAVGPDGSAYLTGYFQGTVDFSGTPLTTDVFAASTNNFGGAYGMEMFVAKYSASGGLLWVHSTRSGRSFGSGISIDSSGNACLIGAFIGNARFGSQTLASSDPLGSQQQAFIAMYDTYGAVAWVKQVSGTASSSGLAIKNDGLNHLLVAGNFNGTASFDGRELPGSTNIFVAKLESCPADSPPLISSQPASQNAFTGATVIFKSGSRSLPPVAFQWMYNGANIQNATNSTFVITNAQYPNQGNYRLVASNANGSSTSSVAVLTIEFPPDFAWAQRAGSSANDEPRAVATDASGNVYVTGYYQGAATFGGVTLTNFSTSLLNDVFVAKYDNAGQLLWAKRAGGVNNDEGRGIAADQGGNVYVTGYFRTNAIFDQFTLSNNAAGSPASIFVVKYDGDGNVLWARKAGSGVSNSEGRSIAIDQTGNALVTGFYTGTASFENKTVEPIGSATATNMFLAKYAPDGNVLWVQNAGATVVSTSISNWVDGVGVAVDKLGNAFVTGSFRQQAHFGTNVLNSLFAPRCFVAKYDDAGNVSWAQSVDGWSALPASVAVDADGNALITGNFLPPSAVVGDITLTNSNTSSTPSTRDIFLIKFASSGDLLWAKRAGGTGEDLSLGVAVDSSGAAYITGTNSSSSLFGNTNLLGAGGFVAKYGNDGSFLWLRQLTNSSGYGLAAIGESVCVAGLYSGSFSYGGRTLSGYGGRDIFILKLGASAPGISDQVRGCAVHVGDSTTFNLLPTGTMPLSYQWLFNGTSIPDATKSSLTLTNISLSDAGQYSVVISNMFGICTSSNALLAVTSDSPVPDLIIDNPSAFKTGNWFIFGIPTEFGTNYYNKSYGNGSAYLQFVPNIPVAGIYQVSEWHPVVSSAWTAVPHFISYDGGSELIGVNQLLNGGHWNLLGSYPFAVGTNGNVRITDAVASPYTVYADAIKFVYLPRATIITPLQNQAVTSGANVSFLVNAAGTAPLTYQWQRNGTNIPGATTSSLNLPGAQPSDTGTYTVLVSSPGGPASSSAVLRVGPSLHLLQTSAALTFDWSGDYVLQKSTNVDGPYFDVPGATSPYTNSAPADAQGFYRLRTSGN